MKIKILTRDQLEGIIYTWFNQHPDCVIDLFDESLRKSIYMSSKKLSDETVLLNITVDDKSIGNPIHIKDHKSKMKWIKDKCGFIDWKYAKLTVYLEEIDNYKSSKLNFIDTYYNEYEQTKESVPIVVDDMNTAMILFLKFLTNDDCNHLVFSFGVYIPCLKCPFKMEIIIDKVYMPSRIVIFFSIQRITEYYHKDTNNFNSFLVIYPNKEIERCAPRDGILEYIPEDDNSVRELATFLYSAIKGVFSRCAAVSKEQINIYAHSNCELI